MADENKGETEVETENLQEKYDELLEELSLKDEEIEKLSEDLENSKNETQEYVSLSQRLQADFENFKKVTEKQNKELIKFSKTYEAKNY